MPSTPNRRPASIRIESEDQRKLRLAQEEAKENEKAKAKAEAEEKARKEKEEAERKVKEAEERKRKEEEAEKERIRKEEEEKERLRKEEEERLRKEEEERLRLEEEARVKREEEARLKEEQEEKERLTREAEEAARAAEQQASIPPAAPVDSDVQAAAPGEQEDGEIEELDKEVDRDESRDKVSDRPPLRLDTSLDKKRPGPLDLSGAKGSLPSSLPSALASARIIDDINRIDYPEGIKSPKVELNVNAKQGKFRYVLPSLLVHQRYALSSTLRQVRSRLPYAVYGYLQREARLTTTIGCDWSGTSRSILSHVARWIRSSPAFRQHGSSFLHCTASGFTWSRYFRGWEGIRWIHYGPILYP